MDFIEVSVFVKNRMFFVFLYLRDKIAKMVWPKASQYKRFNVGQYMKQHRLGWIENEKKAKKSQATAKKLKRLDEKVG